MDTELLSEAVSAGGISTLSYLLLPDYSFKLFVTAGIGCFIYNEVLRKQNKPKTLKEKLIRGVGYGTLAELIGLFIVEGSSVSSLVVIFVSASLIGNVTGPYVNSILKLK